ncbi:uncharacterized protein RCC_01406 [Ramularia collo-cygni]|uniref:DUF7729 domain-containing protein n=1 Tax=Ramularia collo-cygni TaxID=112498 RepID=A0A2D3ULU9_9PEZI|nr:uncharacterized protein RCC_01406 [Ramularia collo-cygni]CZT15552.1 uncharacterized protein RCC_01406 [Ramularia collo-cygni]
MPLLARQDLSEPTPSTTAKPKGAKTSATASSIQTAIQTGAAALPRPFDSSIGTNFTSSSCPDFFNDFLSNQTFNDCLPFSLLLQTSNSFFTASRSLVRLTQTLDATCKVNLDQCTAAMASWAQEIKQTDRCGQDLEMENPVVTQAYNGFVSYKPLYQAACLLDAGGNYCFANAATNASAPTSSYIYYLPLGVELPGGSRPACTTCLQNTMAVFAEAAANKSQPLSADYVGAAEQVQMTCGPSFVGAAVQISAATPTTSSIITSRSLGGLLILSAILMTSL